MRPILSMVLYENGPADPLLTPIVILLRPFTSQLIAPGTSSSWRIQYTYTRARTGRRAVQQQPTSARRNDGLLLFYALLELLPLFSFLYRSLIVIKPLYTALWAALPCLVKQNYLSSHCTLSKYGYHSRLTHNENILCSLTLIIFSFTK